MKRPVRQREHDTTRPAPRLPGRFYSLGQRDRVRRPIALRRALYVEVSLETAASLLRTHAAEKTAEKENNTNPEPSVRGRATLSPKQSTAVT